MGCHVDGVQMFGQGLLAHVSDEVARSLSLGRHKDPAVQKYVKAYQAKFNKVPDVFSMQGYNAGLILFNANKTAKTTDGTKLAEAIAKTKDLQVANGKLTYDEKHNPITTALIIELKDGKMTLNKKIGG